MRLRQQSLPSSDAKELIVDGRRLADAQESFQELLPTGSEYGELLEFNLWQGQDISISVLQKRVDLFIIFDFKSLKQWTRHRHVQLPSATSIRMHYAHMHARCSHVLRGSS